MIQIVLDVNRSYSKSQRNSIYIRSAEFSDIHRQPVFLSTTENPLMRFSFTYDYELLDLKSKRVR